jgi:TonB-dependent starch-binding outer membrane protein SusC
LPPGDILNIVNSQLFSNYGRLQANFSKTFGSHAIGGLLTGEIRETKTESYGRTSYGYNSEYGSAASSIDFANQLPQTGGTGGFIPPSDSRLVGTTQRFVSGLANFSYLYKNRYSLTASGRRDGANIFGVRTNDKITPLWSIGAGWNVSDERFYHINWLEYLRVYSSFGYTGNVYTGSAFLTANFSPTSTLTNLPYGQITSPPNPELRWEKVRKINFGVDFKVINEVLSGKLELFQNDGTDLIEDVNLAPSTGFASFKGNSAKTRTQGADLTITANILRHQLIWGSTINLTYLKDKVLSFSAVRLAKDLAGSPFGTLSVGHSLTGLYSYRMAKIEHETGDPIGYIGKFESKDYTRIVNQTPIDSLIYHGSTRPIFFGNWLNRFSYRGFSVAFSIVGKFKYYFRRPTVDLSYQNLLTNDGIHNDYHNRWLKPGDEVNSSVPSMVYATNDNRTSLYKFSQNLVERADHIRLQDVNISYLLNVRSKRSFPIKSATVYFSMNNVGILWRANQYGYDPDYYTPYQIPNVRTYSLGLKFNL